MSPRSRTSPKASLGGTIAALWLSGYLYLSFSRNTDVPFNAVEQSAFVVTGWGYGYLWERKRLTALLKQFKAIWYPLFALAASIAASEIIVNIRATSVLYDKRTGHESPQVLCFPILALMFTDSTRLKWVIRLFLAFCAWHLVMMPIEAVYGWKMMWPGVAPFWITRDSWIMHFQASGLSYKRFYFSGLHLPMLYVALGLIQAGHVLQPPSGRKRTWPEWIYPLCAVLWFVPAVCTQSRTTVACTVVASLVFILGRAKVWKKVNKTAAWVSVVAALAGTTALYDKLFSTDKSGVDWRWAYFVRYLQDAFTWPAILIGHGTDGDRWSVRVNDPTISYLYHAHNDIADVFWRWGMVTLAVYIVYWMRLIKLSWKDYFSRGEAWPLAALIALVPNMVTDLGFTHFEKAFFIGLFTALCTAVSFRRTHRLS